MFKIVAFDSLLHEPLVPAITKLLHRAYAPLAQKGMHYVASHQGDTKTRARLTEGWGFLALWNQHLVGTASLYACDPENACAYYRRSGVFSFGQFAIEPVHQANGLGSKLLTFLEHEARRQGARELALDTSEHAEQLIKMYQRRGFEIVASMDWLETNYLLVVMAKRLGEAEVQLHRWS